MQKINYKIAFYTLVICGTAMSLSNCFMYGCNMTDWLSVISITSCIILFSKSKTEKKMLNSIMAIIMLALAFLFMIRYLMIRGTITF